MNEVVDATFPSLFSHLKRGDWGVSVLSGENDGKRRYLFEDGEERVMAAAAPHLMQRVQQPNREQQATYARLTALLAKREGATPAGVVSSSKALLEQLEKFRLAYPGGLCSPAWQKHEQHLRARRARQVATEQAQQALSRPAIERLASKDIGAIWTQTVALVASSELASDELQTTSNGDEQRALGESVRDLLHGTDPYERRFDRFMLRYGAVFRGDLSWQAATALPALVSPLDHVCVEPTSFRKQLKALSRHSALGARAGGSAYVRCRAMARTLASALAANGEVPMDLLELQAFIHATA
jgi:hypothetical protein